MAAPSRAGGRPPFTTVDLDPERLGTTAARCLFDALDGRRPSGVIRQPCRRVVRESTSAIRRA
ncbi:substrate-binding domain-containing protein [Saccharothrix sp. NRRL B-16314]|uniref:substrate-binding domain-containing protein n=1 Tax=Saccharothrix sp. NRRL B-16314 TaxID=1463825 RepID=UPI0005260641|nr:substrate-binding domain-containing protein [Saccharothrix sp. NRRL B-16314]